MTVERRTFEIERSKLEGVVTVSGAKNSALRLLAASLLTGEQVVLDNYPDTLLDAQVHVRMLERLGKYCSVEPGRIVIDESEDLADQLQWEGRSIRNTLLILGALVARKGRGAVPLPGGCRLGERKYDLHVMLLERLGARVWEDDGALHAEGRLMGGDIHLPIRSTGATENAILCGALAQGTTRIWNPHVRPEVIQLCEMVTSMGAKVTVHGQEHIEVQGAARLQGTRVRVLPDNMEALTWLVATVATGGEVEIRDFPFRDLAVPLIHLRESGARFFVNESAMVVRGGRCLPVEISTGPYPGINSDMQPLFAVWGALARGQSRIVDLRFPGRYAYADEFSRMGARMSVEANLLNIAGGHPLHGCEVKAADLRAGVALAIAGLTAEGITTVADAWQVERGYDRFIEKLHGLNGRVRATGTVVGSSHD